MDFHNFYLPDARNYQTTELSLIEFKQLEDLCDDVVNELNQDKWMRVVHALKIDSDKLHLIAAAHTCDFQRQKILGLLCWIEDNPKAATFDKLCAAVNAVGNKTTAIEIKTLRRKLLARKIHTAKYQRPQRQLKQQLNPVLQSSKNGTRFEFVKSAMANPVWKLSDPIAPPYYSSYLPQRSVSPSFELTSSVSIQGAKLNLIKRQAWTERSGSPRRGPRSLPFNILAKQSRKRTLGERKTGSINITTVIKTAIPLTKSTFDCHPEEIESKIANKLFDYLLSVNSGGVFTREASSVVATLETIDGLVVKKLRKGSLHIEVAVYRTLAAKTLWTHFQNGQLGEMIQEQLISTTSLRMSGALAISLETTINSDEFEECMAGLTGKPFTNSARPVGRYLAESGRTSRNSPIKSKMISSTNLSHGKQPANNYTRVTSVPASRSITLDLAPNVSTVRPTIRKVWKSNGKSKSDALSSSFSEIYRDEVKGKVQEYLEDHQKIGLEQRPPPPTPETSRDTEIDSDRNLYAHIDAETCKALEEMHKNIHECEDDYKKFFCDIRRFVDSLNSINKFGMDGVTCVSDLRKYATLLRQTDVADTALLVEEFIKLTETLEKIHREASSKVWSKVSTAASVENPTLDLKRIQVKQQATQALERWREMLDPTFHFSQLSEIDVSTFKGYISDEEIQSYSGLLSQVPVLVTTAKSVYKIFLNYLKAS